MSGKKKQSFFLCHDHGSGNEFLAGKIFDVEREMAITSLCQINSSLDFSPFIFRFIHPNGSGLWVLKPKMKLY